MSKASQDDGIPADLFIILKYNAVKVLRFPNMLRILENSLH